MKKRVLLLIFSLALFLNQSFSQAQVDTAVDVSLKTLDSQIINLYDLLNDDKIVVINFFSTSCGPCQTFAHDFQVAYENFGMNQSNVIFLGVNYNGNNYQVSQFADIYGLNLPLSSGLEGGGNEAFEAFEVVSYPTIIIITPDFQLAENYIWEPTAENISNAVVNAGGTLVGLTSRSDYKMNSLTVAPNPVAAVTSLSFALSNPQPLVMQIADLTGRVLINKTVNGVQGENVLQIDTKSLTNGMYIVSLLSETNELFTSKMMVR
jgi:thiol-disulfide isomerase/thioredoxin